MEPSSTRPLYAIVLGQTTTWFDPWCNDLSVLAGIVPSLAVRFNMELSRGATPYSLSDDDALRKKVTGGISVSF